MRRFRLFKGVAFRAVYLLLAVVLLSVSGVGHLRAVNHSAAGIDMQPQWASPSAVAIKRVSEVNSMQNQSHLFSNLDCTALTYRLAGSQTRQTGCFTPTAFGMLDSDSENVIFNGTDEALPLRPYVNQQVLAAWPKALNMLTFTGASTGGSYVSMYDDPLAVMKDQRNALGQLTAKQMTAPPKHKLLDASGRPLLAHAQATAFSDNGSWIVVETIYGYFARINLSSLEVLPFAPAFNSPGGSEPQDAQVAVSDDGRFVAVENGQAPSFKVYDLSTCAGSSPSWQANNCQGHEYWPFASQQIAGLHTATHIRFINDGLLSFEVPDGGPAASGTYELAPATSIGSLTDYLGLGDSYTSGEGAFDYLPGTDTVDNTCHLSARSYPLLLTTDLFSMAGGHSVACSGAVINDISGTGDSYRGQVKNGTSLGALESLQPERLNEILADYSPGYVSQALFVGQYQPRVVTVSVGGNDIGFGDILQKCVVPHISRHTSDGTCYNTYESRQEVVDLVDRTVPRWTALYQQLRALSPGTTIYAVGYPSIASDTGSCALNVNLSKGELEFAEELIHYLDGSVQQAAAAAGVPYVDISQALAGHRLCEASGSAVAVNGLTAGNDFGALGVNVLGRESYHPNALGHELIEQAILRQTNNLTVDTDSQSAPALDSGNLLDAPKTGRTINTLVPDNMTVRVVRPGTSISLRADGAPDGLRANTAYQVHMDGPEGIVLASLASGSDSDLAGMVAIPGGTSHGGHSIDITGIEQNGQPADITQPIYVADTNGDADDDGIADTTDSCPYAVNSGQDTDTDGVDDICDGMIGPAVAPEGGAGGSSAPRVPQRLGPLSASFAPIGHVLGITAAGQVKLSPQSTGHVRSRSHSQPAFSRPAVSGDLEAASLLTIGCISLAISFWGWRRIIKSCRNYFGKLCSNLGKNIGKNNYKNRGPCFTIVIMRKFGVVVFSLILFISLLALAFSTSSNIAFTNPHKLQGWLNDSNLYGAFVESAIDQAEQTAGTDQSGGISLSDTAVKQAAESSFSSHALNQDVNTFLNSNYAWLNSKASKPNFSIDLTGAKQDFAQKVGNYVKTYLTGLPACTAAQTAQINLQTADPLTLSCRPAGVDPATVGSQVTGQISTSTEFLSDPVVTAANVNPNGSINSPAQPYYQRFSALPGIYQSATKIPWVAGVLALLSLIAVIFIAPRKRKGLKAIVIVLALSGLVMIATKLVSNQAFNSIKKHAFNASTVGELQKALTVFLRHAENQLVKVDLWFGIGYLLLALALVAALIITRQRGLRIPKPLQSAVPTEGPAAAPLPKENNTPPTLAKPAPRPRRPKPPRLVQ
ncbi:MAG TPA: SGNH/GDSL hydrolase family protein [Candidatus Saccharimonadales bacterium]|nr:SGNH/GDSL hydrolase family protein [Candidatus Saccharimonadales bacterium]